MFGFAWFLHGTFTNMELNGGSMRVDWIFALLYKALGKWGVVGAISLIAAGTVWMGWTGRDSAETE